jgi:hypothetical protein
MAHSSIPSGTENPEPDKDLSRRRNSIFLYLRDTLRNAPSKPEAFVFELVSIGFSWIAERPLIGGPLKMVGNFIGKILQVVSPALPITIQNNSSIHGDPWKFYLTIFRNSLPIAIFFCLVINGLLTIQTPPPPPPHPNRVYYGKDWHNIAFYIAVVPLYVASAICLIATTVISWDRFNTYSNQAAALFSENRIGNGTRFSCFLVIGFLASGLFIANYIEDLRDPTITKQLYWFFDKAGSGERVLNRAGAYYLFMNAVLLFITAMAALCYISMSIEMVRLGRHIESSLFAVTEEELTKLGESAIAEREKRMKMDLSDFSFCLIWAKWLCLFYAINIWIWQISPAGQVKNVHAAIVALALIGLFFLIVPRLYLGSKWHRLKNAYAERWNELSMSARRTSDIGEVEYRDFRSGDLQKMSWIIDFAFVGVLGKVIFDTYGLSIAGILEFLQTIARTFRLWV